MRLLEHIDGTSEASVHLGPLFIVAVCGALALGLSLFLPFVVRPLLMRLGIMDVPNARSSHTRPVLRGLGLAVLAAMVIAAGIAAILFQLVGLPGWGTLLVVIGGFGLSGLLGLREDLRGLSVLMRSIVLLVIGLAAAVLLLIVAEPTPVLVWVSGLPITPIPVAAMVALVVYAVLFTSSYINVANFMDGLNGISGLHGVIAGLTFCVAGAATGLDWLMIAGVVLAAGFLGFLPWNLTKPGAFLGDVGSYLLGGAMAITSFAALINGVPFLATIGPMVIYFGDVGVTLVKRVRSGKKWHEPHKEHTYQRIQQMGYSHIAASATVAACTLLTSILGIVSIFTGLYGTLALLVGGIAVLIFYLALPSILPVRPR